MTRLCDSLWNSYMISSQSNFELLNATPNHMVLVRLKRVFTSLRHARVIAVNIHSIRTQH